MSRMRALASTAVLNEYICIAGGDETNMNSSVPYAPVELYDPKLDEWTQMTPLDIPGNRHAITEWRGSLYAIGGLKGQSSVMKKFDSLKNKWTLVCELSS